MFVGAEFHRCQRSWSRWERGRRQDLQGKSLTPDGAGVEGDAAAIGTCKKSLNQSWGCSGKTL